MTSMSRLARSSGCARVGCTRFEGPSSGARRAPPNRSKEGTMGLDTVELVMEVEEAFGITIPDQEAEKIQTVGDLYHYILATLGGPPLTTPGCLSAAAFYRLRRQLMGRFRIERRRIQPASTL